MLSIRNVSPEQARTYYGKDNYYTKDVGFWDGKAAEALGLSGELANADFNNLLEGKAPTGKRLVQKGSNGVHQAAYDLTFSAPKSVSVLSEIVGDKRVAEAHDKAVQQALEYVEHHFSQARPRGRLTDTGNLLIAKFEHNLSRELDPQLHTHCLVFNITQTKPNKWQAIVNREFYNNKMLIGQLYRSELAKELSELGYTIQQGKRGLFEVQGINSEVLKTFSERSEQIKNILPKFRKIYPNTTEAEIKALAAIGSRTTKKEVTTDVLKQHWQEKLASQGYSVERLRAELHTMAKSDKQKQSAHDYIRTALQAETQQESTFSQGAIIRKAAQLSVGQYRVADLEIAFSDLKVYGRIKQLSNQQYTTKEMLNIEQNIVNRVKNGRDKQTALFTEAKATEAINNFNKTIKLTGSQKDAIRHILTSKDSVTGIQGDAGTGKTTMLNCVRELLEAKGYEVKGLTFTGKAAAELQESTKIDSQTLHSFLSQEQAQNRKQVWLVDEASMVGSRQLYSLLKAADNQQARVVLVGDTKQLQAIEAGKMFAKLQEKQILKTITMKDIIRQQVRSLKRIAKNIAEKKIDAAFKKLVRQKRVKEITERGERLAAIANDFVKRDVNNTLIVTARNFDKNVLNLDIKAKLKASGKLNGNEYTFTTRESKNLSPIDKHLAQNYAVGDILYAQQAGIIGRAGSEAVITAVNQQNHTISVQDREGRQHTINLTKDGNNIAAFREHKQTFSEGERIVFLKNDRKLGIQNGLTGKIEKVNEQGDITVRINDTKAVSFNIKQYQYIDAGYAVTTYKSQGQSINEVIYHASTKQNVQYNEAYVALTRGKRNLTVYTDSKEQLRKQMENEQEKTSTLDKEKGEKKEVGKEATTRGRGKWRSKISFSLSR